MLSKFLQKNFIGKFGKKAFIITGLVVSLLLVLCVCGMIAYGSSRNNSNTGNQADGISGSDKFIESSNPEQIKGTGIYSDWKYFSSDTFGIQFFYPKEFLVLESPDQESLVIKTSNDSYQLMFEKGSAISTQEGVLAKSYQKEKNSKSVIKVGSKSYSISRYFKYGEAVTNTQPYSVNEQYDSIKLANQLLLVIYTYYKDKLNYKTNDIEIIAAPNEADFKKIDDLLASVKLK